MHIALIPPSPSISDDCLKEALALPGAGRLFQEALLKNARHGGFQSAGLFVPAEWVSLFDNDLPAVRTFQAEGIPVESLNGVSKAGLLMTNARLNGQYSPQKLHSLLDPSKAAVIAVELAPDLAAPNEMVRLTPSNRIVGFRRIFEDAVEPAAVIKPDFPALVYIPPMICDWLKQQGPLPLDLEVLSRRLAQERFPIRRFRLGGHCRDLTTVEGVLCLLESLPFERLELTADAAIDSAARLTGPVWVGRGVHIGHKALVVGPAILCDGVRIEADAVVRNAVLGPNLTVGAGQSIQDTLCTTPNTSRRAVGMRDYSRNGCRQSEAFRHWPLLSYPRLGKRICDILFSSCILLLISPILAIVTVMVKLTSRGPVFYRARRQGRHGKEFDCLKFRTMMVQADALQERLRVVNQVDGPQFKIDNDPRITGVGKFLRDTCIDELPQFINVLAGQMSVVGPRPSPESENESCPPWRDARLSVSPGITGLWQVCRTRREGEDFQEWVYYDSQYVRNLSFRRDLSICLKTAAKLINNFLDQFG